MLGLIQSRRYAFAVLSISTLLTLGACGGTYHKYDTTVSNEQRELIEKDMDRLADSNMVARSQDDLKTIAITDFSGDTLIEWLKTRNRVVVGEEYDWNGDNLVTSQKVSSPPQLLTSAQVDLASVAAGGTVTVMVNLGASIYLSSVEKGIVYTVKAAEEEIQIWSPRSAGMIQVGEGLFNKMISSSDIDSYAHSVRRGSTYLHEATHTDGNGEHRAFAHATCPETYYREEFRGQYACEKYLNGPYSRQVVFLRYAIPQMCAANGCSSAEQDSLLKTMADYDSRKLSGASFVDQTPEGYGLSSLQEISFVPALGEMILK